MTSSDISKNDDGTPFQSVGCPPQERHAVYNDKIADRKQRLSMNAGMFYHFSRRSRHDESDMEQRRTGRATTPRSSKGITIFRPARSIGSIFMKSTTHTVCSWKGTASYYDVVVDGQTNKDAAWYYPAPKEAARNIAGYVAFWKGVQVIA